MEWALSSAGLPFRKPEVAARRDGRERCTVPAFIAVAGAGFCCSLRRLASPAEPIGRVSGRPFAGITSRLFGVKSIGLERREIVCTGCGSHLGFLFDDDKTPGGWRFSVILAALIFRPGRPRPPV